MQFTSLFWFGFSLPVITVLLLALLPYMVWRKQSNPDKVFKIKLNNATPTFVAGISVLAIAIPLGANLLLQLIQTGERGLASGLILAGLALAVMSLATGGYLIYKLSLETKGEDIEIKGGKSSSTLWIPTAISFQLVSMVTFIVITFLGLLVYILFPVHADVRVMTTESSHFAVVKSIPDLGETYDNIVQDWGNPGSSGKDWLVYSTRDSNVTFCFTNDRLTKIIEIQKGIGDANKTGC